MKTLTVLGSTGSIGTNTLDVVRRNRHLYQVYALAAGSNINALADQIQEFHPKIAVVATSDGLQRLWERLAEIGFVPSNTVAGGIRRWSVMKPTKRPSTRADPGGPSAS